jgi:hypothetical protein
LSAKDKFVEVKQSIETIQKIESRLHELVKGSLALETLADLHVIKDVPAIRAVRDAIRRLNTFEKNGLMYEDFGTDCSNVLEYASRLDAIKEKISLAIACSIALVSIASDWDIDSQHLKEALEVLSSVPRRRTPPDTLVGPVLDGIVKSIQESALRDRLRALTNGGFFEHAQGTFGDLELYTLGAKIEMRRTVEKRGQSAWAYRFNQSDTDLHLEWSDLIWLMLLLGKFRSMRSDFASMTIQQWTEIALEANSEVKPEKEDFAPAQHASICMLGFRTPSNSIKSSVLIIVRNENSPLSGWTPSTKYPALAISSTQIQTNENSALIAAWQRTFQIGYLVIELPEMNRETASSFVGDRSKYIPPQLKELVPRFVVSKRTSQFLPDRLQDVFIDPPSLEGLMDRLAG